MKVYGNLRKMSSELHDEVHYKLPFFDATSFSQEINLNALIGQTINISYSGIINCVITGKKIKKLMVMACHMMHLNRPL